MRRGSLCVGKALSRCLAGELIFFVNLGALFVARNSRFRASFARYAARLGMDFPRRIDLCPIRFLKLVLGGLSLG